MSDLIQQIYEAVLEGQSPEVQSKVQAALDAGCDPAEILNGGMIGAMAEVGRLFESGEYFVPEMLISARAMQAGMTILKPHLQASDIKSAGRVIIGTVKGDLHDIGKNLVLMMLEGAGFTVIDLGVDVPPEAFIDAVTNKGAQILGMSALLTTTMPSIKLSIDAIREAGIRDKVKIMIGGAPVTQSFADEVGADGYSPDAASAADLAKLLISQVA